MMGANYFSGTVWAVGRTRVLLFAIAVMVALLCGLFVTAEHAYAATFTVNSTGDQNDLDFPGGTFDGSSDGTCDVDSGTTGGQCTLRAAIQHANVTSGADNINFAIPGNGPHVISPSPGLPTITQAVIIDGYTQGDATATTDDDARENTLAAGTDAVLKIEINGTNFTSSSGLTIGGNASNVVIRGLVINRVDSAGTGIRISSNAGTGHRIEGNFIGTNASGTAALPNLAGGILASSGNDVTIGGDTPAKRNLISGNGGDGVDYSLGPASGLRLENNIIGLDKNGNPLGNSGNGVVIGSGPLSSNTGNSILSNSIASNGGLGIDLGNNGVTPNDGKDPDTGANNLQNFPALASATRASDGATTIAGNLKSTPRKVFTIQFFSSPAADPSGFGEGEEFLGELNVRTSRKGTVSFRFITIEDVAAGEVVTATATAFSTGDTSEFSAARTVAQGS